MVKIFVDLYITSSVAFFFHPYSHVPDSNY
jgi:hypothetical protein